MSFGYSLSGAPAFQPASEMLAEHLQKHPLQERPSGRAGFPAGIGDTRRASTQKPSPGSPAFQPAGNFGGTIIEVRFIRRVSKSPKATLNTSINQCVNTAPHQLASHFNLPLPTMPSIINF